MVCMAESCSPSRAQNNCLPPPCLPRNNASLLMSRAPRTHSAEALFNRRRKWRRDDRLREPFIGSSSLSQFFPFIQRDES